jgi:two-component system, NarL family, sensor kinase
MRAPNPVVQFALSGLVALVVVGVGSVFVFQRAGEREAVRDARVLTGAVARGVVEPHLTRALVDGDPRSVAEFDRFVRARVLTGDVIRVKLWKPDGTVIYSDEHRLIGQRYPLADDELDALEDGQADAELSDLSEPENRYERHRGKLLEVYLPVRAPGGRPLLFESYQPFAPVSASGRDIWREFAPTLLAALILLWLIQLPLAWSFVRRLRQGQLEREALFIRTVNASDTERRRIAADLHDGVVQDLAGISMSLSAATQNLGREAGGSQTATLEVAAADTREAMRRLRGVLFELHPANLHVAGLGAALRDLLVPLRARGIDTQLSIPEDLRLSEALEALMFRTAQEAIRNAVTHSGARSIRVTVRADGDHATMEVADDGSGIDPAQVTRRRGEGHVGLALLAARAADEGAELRIASTPGAGTAVTLVAPR